MRSWGRLLACGTILISGALLSGCTMDSPAVATVGGSTITQEEYLSMLELTPGARGMPSGLTVMDQLIQNKLLLQEARRQGVAPTQQEMNNVINYLRTQPDFQADLQQTGLSEEQFAELFIRPQLAIAGLMGKMANVTDAEIQAYFEQNKAALTQPPTIRARVLQFPDRDTAQKALALAGKSTPESIAQTFLGSPQAAQIVPLTQQGSPYPEQVVDAAFKTEEGAHTGIIEAIPAPSFLQPQAAPAATQYYIVFVEEKLPAREADLQNPIIRNQIKQILAQQKLGQGGLSPTAFEDMIRNLRAEASKNNQIQVIRPTVKQVEKGLPEPAGPAGMGLPPQ